MVPVCDDKDRSFRPAILEHKYRQVGSGKNLKKNFCFPIYYGRIMKSDISGNMDVFFE
jgi:hypothetical protein